jgi:hypothetical protein
MLIPRGKMMASTLSKVSLLNQRVPAGESGYVAIHMPPVEVYDIETVPEKRAEMLKQLLKANHVKHSLLYHNLLFHNHMPHILCSAYLLGGSEPHLQKVFNEESKQLELWQTSPHKITENDWRDFLGDRRYQRAYVDFFEDNLASSTYCSDWKKVVEKYMFQGKEPLVNDLIGGGAYSPSDSASVTMLTSLQLAMPSFTSVMLSR